MCSCTSSTSPRNSLSQTLQRKFPQRDTGVGIGIEPRHFSRGTYLCILGAASLSDGGVRTKAARARSASPGNRTRLENQLLIKELSLECLPKRSEGVVYPSIEASQAADTFIVSRCTPVSRERKALGFLSLSRYTVQRASTHAWQTIGRLARDYWSDSDAFVGREKWALAVAWHGSKPAGWKRETHRCWESISPARRDLHTRKARYSFSMRGGGGGEANGAGRAKEK